MHNVYDAFLYAKDPKLQIGVAGRKQFHSHDYFNYLGHLLNVDLDILETSPELMGMK